MIFGGRSIRNGGRPAQQRTSAAQRLNDPARSCAVHCSLFRYSGGGSGWGPSPWIALAVLFFCVTGFLPLLARAASNSPAANVPLVADPAPPPVPRIVDTFDKQPIRRAQIAAQTDTQSSTTDATPSTLELPRLLAAMALVVGLIFFLRWLGRRFFGATPISAGTRAVQVLSRSPVAPRQSVMLMQVGRRLLVVADNGSQLSSLSEITDPDEVAALVGQLRGEKLDIAGRTFGAIFGRIKKDEVAEPVDVEAAPISEPAVEMQPDVSGARAELGSLMEQVRLVSNQFRS